MNLYNLLDTISTYKSNQSLNEWEGFNVLLDTL